MARIIRGILCEDDGRPMTSSGPVVRHAGGLPVDADGKLVVVSA